MKSLMLIMVVFLITSCSSTQEISKSNVPEPVKMALSQLYPNAEDIDWEKEDENYEANFEINNQEYSTVFDSTGNLLETEVEIATNELPAAIPQYISKNYVGSKIKEANKITDFNGIVTYETEIKGKDLIFDEQGNFIKEVAEK